MFSWGRWLNPAELRLSFVRKVRLRASIWAYWVASYFLAMRQLRPCSYLEANFFAVACSLFCETPGVGPD